MSEPIQIVWFRQDLRLNDNPALVAAAQKGKILPIYILDDDNAGDAKMGAASRVWLYHSLTKLSQACRHKLRFYQGDAKKIILDLVQRYNVAQVHWSRCYEPWRRKRDNAIAEALKQQGVMVKSHSGSLLWEPEEVLKSDGTPYRVFTPFYRNICQQSPPPRQPLTTPELRIYGQDEDGIELEALGLLPEVAWDKPMMRNWQVGEESAWQRLQDFLANGLKDYKSGRNFPAQNNVSRLSPHLHFGEVSPNQVWYAAKAQGENSNSEHFCSELAWREFSYSLLYYNPDLNHKNLQEKFDKFPWADDEKKIHAWQRGLTGYPIVDAGMRELWQTGYMHNRVRMIVGSFLVKNLLCHWHHGERWFWDCLVDADHANNSASWQWVAGCGADAAPYFRIFNPITQGEKFDAEGEYTRHYVPELKDLPKKYLYCPWQAPAAVLEQAGVKLGVNYPEPIVDLRSSREKALQAYGSLKRY